MKYLGLVVNPIAGMGGKVGLKGTDGKAVLEKARALGSKPESPIKAVRALEKLLPLKDELTVLVAEGDMGENEAREAGLNYEVVYSPKGQETDTSDTTEVCKIFEERGVALVLFVGGDGTARDVFNAIGTRVPAVGVPAGVKIYSAVHGNTPESAGHLAHEYLSGKSLPLQESEVIDLDEEGFRKDEVNINIYGYLNVPQDAAYLQNLKSPSPQSDDEAQVSIALRIIDDMEDDIFYIISSGTTTAHIMQELKLPHTVLGVDIIKNKELVAKDVNEQQILDVIGNERVKLVGTPMGGQGYIFGRGNQQISGEVLKHLNPKDITIVATPGKMRTIGNRPFLIYTLNDEVDAHLSGYYRVVTGYQNSIIHKAESLND